MDKLHFTIFFIAVVLFSSCKKEISTIGFYNLENLFDTLDNPHINDSEFLPESDKGWNTQKYNAKLDSLAKVISLMSEGKAPTVLGLCEMENEEVIKDLVNRQAIKKYNYSIAHEESDDRRGIDVSLIYNSNFTLKSKEEIKVVIEEDENFRSRDILHAILMDRKKNEFHIYVNHWPSRYGGQKESDPKRLAASMAIKTNVQKVLSENPNANIIVMGDFNDEPVDPSMLNLYKSDSFENGLFNTFYALDSAQKGSYCYRDEWNMLDQILISDGLKNSKNPKYIKDSATIFGESWMKQKGEDNRYNGYPLRTWGGNTYLGGYSDHFPVYIKIEQ